MSFGPTGPAEAYVAPLESIYGVICRVRGSDVETHVPSHFKVSAATDLATSYVRDIAQELLRLPHRYGYDPNASYTVLVQTWDRALTPTPSLAFGREVKGQEMVGLIPDVYYISERGYANLYKFGLRTPLWSKRSAAVVWRGSVTGQGPFSSPAEIPRVKLALTCRDMAGADVALIGVHETMRELEPMLTDLVQEQSLLAPRWPSIKFCYYKYSIDIDGHANAWGLLEKLILGCCVLKVDTPFEQWFYPRLHAWEHYIPIAADLSDISEALQWCRRNDAHCQWIAANGVRLAASVRFQAELARSCLEFMRVAQVSR